MQLGFTKACKRMAQVSAISPWTKAYPTHIASTSKENIFTSVTHQACYDEGKAFKYLQQKFRQISESKIKKELNVYQGQDVQLKGLKMLLGKRM
jgi:hypothetical protein